jgi:hypothetical protein
MCSSSQLKYFVLSGDLGQTSIHYSPSAFRFQFENSAPSNSKYDYGAKVQRTDLKRAICRELSTLEGVKCVAPKAKLPNLELLSCTRKYVYGQMSRLGLNLLKLVCFQNNRSLCICFLHEIYSAEELASHKRSSPSIERCALSVLLLDKNREPVNRHDPLWKEQV